MSATLAPSPGDELSREDARAQSWLSTAQEEARRWFLDRGGDAAVALSRDGGRMFLAQGDIAPFTPATVKALIAAGVAEYYGPKGRMRLRVFALRAMKPRGDHD